MCNNFANNKYKVLWAKSEPRHPLWKHLLDVAAVSLALPPPLTEFGWNSEQTALLVGLHDIGKADACFQHKSFSDELKQAGFPPTADSPCRHERISAEFVAKKIAKNGVDEYTVDAISRAVVVHHGYWNECAREVSEPYAEAQCQLYQMLQLVIGVEGFPNKKPQNLSDFGMRLAGHVVLCDWIASNEEFFTDTQLQDTDDPEEYFSKAKEVATNSQRFYNKRRNHWR